MSSNIKATVIRRSDGEPVAHVNAQDPADLQRYETDEFTLFDGIVDPETHIVNMTTMRKNKRIGKRPVPIEAVKNMAKRRRDTLLKESEWTVLRDSPLTEANQLNWLEYRHNLHLLFAEDPDPLAVVWPEQPPMSFPPISEARARKFK
jgi:hypothetical protein